MTDSVVLYALTILTEAFTNSCDGNDDNDDDDRGGDGDMAMIIRTAETMKTMMAMINIMRHKHRISKSNVDHHRNIAIAYNIQFHFFFMMIDSD